ncbi:hypothetical protein VTK73DRAFT_9880 [Phialemonium thermophilum]|uniref:Zn(2)-C6 fungal-type domain-containing protein n=1 Tax=Phialemonium thermophilum TaxID=223376 RepID=A0ABR3VZP8_9PEZI
MAPDLPPSSTERSPHPNRSRVRKCPILHRPGLKRNAAACQRCKRRKQKCDGRLPVCGNCAASDASCIPSERLVIRTDTRDESAELRDHIARLEGEVVSLRKQLAQEQQTHAQLAQHIRARDGDRCNGPTYDDDIPDRARLLRPTFVPHEQRDPGFRTFWSSPWLLWEEETIAQQISNTVDPDDIPMDAYGPELIDVFFTRHWPQWPILHRGTFMQQHYEPLVRGKGSNVVSSFQVNMVFAIAASTVGGMQDRSLSHHQFFRIAVRDLNRVRNADDLDCIQCLLLLCIYATHEPQAVNMWYATGLTLRLALGIDLHRLETINLQPFFRAEMMKRIFWGVYVMDITMSIMMGRPLGIQDADITTPLPCQITDDQLWKLHAAPMATGAASEADDTSAFIHMIQLSRINADIYMKFHTAGRSGMDSLTLDTLRPGYYTRLNDWLVAAPRYFPAFSMYQMSEWFQMSYYQGVLSLYRPSHGAPGSSIDSIRLCLDSSISIISCYSSLHAKNRITYTFTALNSLFMAAVTMLYSLRASAAIRRDLGRSVAEANIRTCLTLLRGMGCGRSIGERSAAIIERLCQATLAVFDQPVQLGEQVDTEFLAWFGLKCSAPQVSSGVAGGGVVPEPGQVTPAIDTAWNDLFSYNFEFENLEYMQGFY